MRVLPLFAVMLTSPLAAQGWDEGPVSALVRRAIAARAEATGGGARTWQGTAEGTLLFLVEAGLDPVPRLAKADQLHVEVYWQAPNRSKQVIRAWRSRTYLPVELHYHRDHLGIVTNDFGDRIVLGQGDEVRGVLHPLAPTAPAHYAYALGNALAIQAGGRTVRVHEVLVRPRRAAEPLVAGSLYLEEESAQLVRFRFGFTPAAYLQSSIETITVVLESALVDQRVWLPWRQEIEIRRRTAWLDVPFRTIIRGRWEMAEVTPGVLHAPARFDGPVYDGLLVPSTPDSVWGTSLDSLALAAVGEATRADLERVRAEARALVGRALEQIPPPVRARFGALSDLARVSRVEGLALGFGMAFRAGPATLVPRVGYGVANRGWTGGARIEFAAGGTTLSFDAGRSVRDYSDWAPISGFLNTVLAQEGGQDFLDWVRVDRVMAGADLPTSRFGRLRVEGGLEHTADLPVAAAPARGTYRANPPLGDGQAVVARARWDAPPVEVRPSGLGGWVALEAGEGGTGGYARLAGELRGWVPVGPGRLGVRLRGGAGTAHLPAWRGFAIGGRGSLPGTPFRAWTGRQGALLRVDWAASIPVPALGLGPWLTTGSSVRVAPFVAAGWTGGALPALPGARSGGFQPVLGVASELLLNLIRVEAAWAPRERRVGLVLDASPAWWPLL